uniref:Uncharacterized protein n=1 Tax=Stomoxys calcitrans TaxID=35570 RepID=A0A1I8PUQ8_STOCA
MTLHNRTLLSVSILLKPKMKKFLAIFAFALAIQVVFAHPFETAEELKDARENFQQMVNEIRRLSEMNTNEIPDTEEYSNYKNGFQNILKRFDVKNDTVVCSAKMAGIVEDLYKLFTKVKNDESAVGKKIYEIAMKNRNLDFPKTYKVGINYSDHPELFEQVYC